MTTNGVNKPAVVIPCKNEGDTIGEIVLQCRKHGCVVYVVDDSSTDNTAAMATIAGARVIDAGPRRGMSDVYRKGLLVAMSAGHQWIFELDAGGSHDPADIPRFLAAAKGSGVDAVFGRRFGKDAAYLGKWKRRLLSWVGTLVFNLVHGASWQDATSGYILYSVNALFHTHTKPFVAAGHYYQSEVRLRLSAAGLTHAELPITYRNSKSWLRNSSITEAVRVLLTVRR